MDTYGADASIIQAWIVKYREGVYDPGYERCAYMDENGDAVIEKRFPKKGIKKPDKDQQLYTGMEVASEDGRYAAHVEGTSVLIEGRKDKKEIFVRLGPDEAPSSLFWSGDADKLLIGYADKIYLYNMETETLSDAVQLGDADMSYAVWMWMDASTALYVGSTYSYVIDVSEGHFGILYKLKGFYGYDPEGREIYFESQIFSMDKLNEGVYYDALEVGRIERYSKEEIIEKAREMAAQDKAS